MAGGRAPRSARIAVWGAAIAALLIAAAAAATLLRWDDRGPEARCAASGGVWDFEQQVCAPPHGAGETGR